MALFFHVILSLAIALYTSATARARRLATADLTSLI
jgi:hypothetical protein